MLQTLGYDTKAQELYWRKMTQFKFDLLYISYHFSYCVKAMRFIRIGTAAATALTTAVWAKWNSVPFVGISCAIAIVLLQAFSACAELLPFEKRIQEIRELLTLFDPIYSAMEKDWLQIADGQYTKDKIYSLIYEYGDKRQSIQQHFLKDDSLPAKKRFTKKAQMEANEYFEMFT